VLARGIVLSLMEGGAERDTRAVSRDSVPTLGDDARETRSFPHVRADALSPRARRRRVSDEGRVAQWIVTHRKSPSTRLYRVRRALAAGGLLVLLCRDARCD